MPRQRKQTPSYLQHKKSGRGRLVWHDATGIRREKLLPGPFGSEESLAAKARLELELVTSPTRTAGTVDKITVMELAAAYRLHAERYYVDQDGNPTREVKAVVKYALQALDLYGGETDLAEEFGPRKLAAVRQSMVDTGLSRPLINKRVNVIRRAFRWAASEELIPAAVFEALRTLPGLRRGRTSAREPDPVKPIDDATVDATLPHLPPHVRTMVEILRYTGMRPAEVCSMTLGQVERGSTWLYKPRRHKTSHHGKGRVIPLGPRAKDALTAFLAGRVLDPDEPIFSPRRARLDRFAEMRAARKSKVQPSQVDRRRENPKKVPGERYTPQVIGRAVELGCRRAFPLPASLARNENESVKEWRSRLTPADHEQIRTWRRAHHWHPYQLRHAVGTKVRKEFGLEASQVTLGHSNAAVTEIYAERDLNLAARVAAKIG